MTTEQAKIGIWWLASYPKSGSTWARQVINSAITGFPPNINAGFQYVTGDHGAPFYGCTSAVPADDMDESDVLSYRLAALRNQLAMFPERDAVLKTHHACLVPHNVPLIPDWLTKGAVYIVRDPRDVAVSLAKHIGATIDEAIELMGRDNAGIMVKNTNWKHYLSSWSIHVKSWLDEKNPLQAGCVRYEDMHANPLKAFRKMFDCLGLARITDERISMAIEQCRIDKLREQEEKHGFKESSKHTDKFFGKGQVGGWENALTGKQVEQIESDHGAIMEELGYELTTISALA